MFKHVPKLNYKHPAVWVATWGGCGFLRPGPGTWGTVGALPFGILIALFGGPFALIAATILVTIAGFWASKIFEEMSGEKDSSMIVIDEVAGMWLTLIVTPMTPFGIAAAFVLFRIFDIFKPFPASYFDKNLTGPLSVMGDDLIAGLYAGLILFGASYAGYSF